MIDFWNKCCKFFQPANVYTGHLLPINPKLSEDQALTRADYDQAAKLYVLTNLEHGLPLKAGGVISDSVDYVSNQIDVKS